MWIRTVLAAALLSSLMQPARAAEGRARNVILMIADGAGFNTVRATSMYEGKLGKQVYDGPEWIRLAASTHPLRQGETPLVSKEHGRVQVPHLVYDPVRAWDTTRVEGEGGGKPYYFRGYRWLRETAPGSASTASALVTGQKIYNGGINFDGDGKAIEETMARIAKRSGRRTGAVSTVWFAHATPAAGGGAHHASRREMAAIAQEMLRGESLDVIAGCGNPDFDNNGKPIEEEEKRIYDHVGGPGMWALLRGEAQPDDGTWLAELSPEDTRAFESWVLVESRERIEALLEGETPDKLLVLPRVGARRYFAGVPGDPKLPHRNTVSVGGALQQQRGSVADPSFTAPGDDPLLPGIPSLKTLAGVAINALDDDPEGFFLVIEGGAVDWAMHENQMGRMIEEMLDFNRAVESVARWIEKNGGWKRNLLIVTADHDHMLWGPNAHRVPFDPIVDNGPGKLPSYRWLTSGHSNALVPVFARGAGAARLLDLVVGTDPFYGPYVDQTDIFEVMRGALD